MNTIRLAKMEDMPALLSLYDIARATMRKSGNPTQWSGGYPNEAVLGEDIARSRLYCFDEDGRIVGAFVYFFGEEPDYAVIEGAWLNAEPYGVLHRVAALPGLGLSARIFAFAAERCANTRIDTHEDNAIMRHVLEKNGFAYCGTIYLKSGDPRRAYHRCTEGCHG